MRLALLGTVAWIAHLTQSALSLFGHAFCTARSEPDRKGLFLVWKATGEMHHRVAGNEGDRAASGASPLSRFVDRNPKIVMHCCCFGRFSS
jgi:predicted tellurium resistance membrane protein TerC